MEGITPLGACIYNHSHTFSAQNDILRGMGLEQETTTFYYQYMYQVQPTT